MIYDHKYKIDDQILWLNVWEQWKCEARTILSTPEMRAICLKPDFVAADYSNILVQKVDVRSFRPKYKSISERARGRLTRMQSTNKDAIYKQGQAKYASPLTWILRNLKVLKGCQLYNTSQLATKGRAFTFNKMEVLIVPTSTRVHGFVVLVLSGWVFHKLTHTNSRHSHAVNRNLNLNMKCLFIFDGVIICMNSFFSVVCFNWFPAFFSISVLLELSIMTITGQ